MLTAERARELLHYDPETGVFTWRVRVSSRKLAGSVAGGFFATVRYRRITVDRKTYREHRLAWLYSYGRFPEQDLDHIDCDPSNNRLANLREADKSQNQWNSPRQKNNSSGVRGVYWYMPRNCWRAVLSVRGKSLNLGNFADMGRAVSARKKAEARYHGEFAPIRETKV